MSFAPTRRPGSRATDPLVVDKVVQAFQNDPRTKLARTMVEGGSSTAPVYGWADGIARVLQGVAGGISSKNELKRSKEAEAELIAAGQRTGEQGLQSMGFAPVNGGNPVQGTAAPLDSISTPASQQAAPMAQLAPQIAAQMGAPAPQGGQGAPLQASPPPAPLAAAQAAPAALGGQPGGELPFAGTPSFVDPLAGRGRVTSKFGPRKAPTAGASTLHNGVDYAAAGGTPVSAAGDGVVIAAWNDPKGGNSVRIRHADGSITGYAHMAGFSVKKGDKVAAGQPIGQVGSTGKSTGNHLHFTYRDPSGKRVDPTSLKYGQAAAPAPQQSGSGVQPEFMAEVPNAPAPVARPDAPDAEAATKSRMLEAAYRMMAEGNPYQYDQAQEMVLKGLGAQDDMDEAATARRQRLKDMGYEGDLNDFNNSRSDARRAVYDERQSAINHNYGMKQQVQGQGFQRSERLGGEAFTAGENAKNRSFESGENALERASRMELARMSQASKEEREAARREAKRSMFLQTSQGQRAINDFKETSKASQEINSLVDMFSDLNSRQDTGGIFKSKAPEWIGTWGNEDLQSMSQITSQLALVIGQKMKGSFSDSDVKFLLNQVPSYYRKKGTNDRMGTYLKNAARRHSEMAQWSFNYAENQKLGFEQDWARYVQDTSIRDKQYITFEEYMNAKQGKRLGDL